MEKWQENVWMRGFCGQRGKGMRGNEGKMDEKEKNETIKETGQMTLEENREKHRIHLLTIIGEVEGHECLASNLKSTKYEHVLPQLAALEDDQSMDGSVGGLFIYCAHCHHDDPSGADEWNDHRCSAKL